MVTLIQTYWRMDECSCKCPSDSIFYGMCEYTGCPFGGEVTAAPPTNIEKAEPTRFLLTDNEDQMKLLAEGLQPRNTANSTKWALHTYQEWCKARSNSELESVPTELLQSNDPEKLCKFLSLFVVEARKKSGERYPPSTIHQILCGLLHHMRQQDCTCPNFLDKGDMRFKPLHNTLDAHFHNLHSEGVGVKVKHAEITEEDEMKLWSSGVTGLHTPAALQNAVFCSEKTFSK